MFYHISHLNDLLPAPAHYYLTIYFWLQADHHSYSLLLHLLLVDWFITIILDKLCSTIHIHYYFALDEWRSLSPSAECLLCSFSSFSFSFSSSSIFVSFSTRFIIVVTCSLFSFRFSLPRASVTCNLKTRPCVVSRRNKDKF